ncbi:MAG: GPW/gp25 family protein [Cyanobacteria bacterium P01_A01_bin.68]
MVNDSNQLDLLLTRRYTGGLISDRESVDIQNIQRDLVTVVGVDNLTQAIVNRLHTRQGELANLGHPDYGSRLYQLVGELNNNRTRALAELYIRECLAQESRIQEEVEVIFQAPERGINRNVLKVTLSVKPVDKETLLTFGLSLNLGG